jgi:uncharacterized membrane protein
LFLHVVGAVVWIGVGLTGQAILVWADRREEHEFVATLYRWVAWVEPAAAVLGPLLLIVTGVGLVLDGPWGFGDTWVVIGLGGYVAALVLGGALQAPGTKRVNSLLRERGAEDSGTITAMRRLNAYYWLELATLLIVLLAMTTKPTGPGSIGFWTLVVSILAGAGFLTARGLRGSAPGQSLASRSA